MHANLNVFAKNQIADHRWDFWILEIYIGNYK